MHGSTSLRLGILFGLIRFMAAVLANGAEPTTPHEITPLLNGNDL